MRAAIILLAGLLVGNPAAANIDWTWSNAGTGTEQGTFITTGELDGAQAPAGAYAILDFSVTASTHGLPLGSVSGGQFTIGAPDIGFDWNGSAPTVMWQSSGTWPIGFALSIPGAAWDEPEMVSFAIGRFSIRAFEPDITFLDEHQTVILAPVTTAVAEGSFGRIKALYR